MTTLVRLAEASACRACPLWERARDEKRRHEAFEGFVADLERAAALVP